VAYPNGSDALHHRQRVSYGYAHNQKNDQADKQNDHSYLSLSRGICKRLHEHKQNGIQGDESASDGQADKNHSLRYPKNGRREMADRANPWNAQDGYHHVQKGDQEKIHPLHPDLCPCRQALKEDTDRDLLPLDEGKGGSHRGRVNEAESDKLLPADDRGLKEVT